jgi:hypothetical protein
LDRVVKIDVGGTQFTSLHSTLAISPTLQRHLAAADANTALLKDGAVFIDRDPASFPVVLQHLRNQAANLHYPTKLARLKRMSNNSFFARLKRTTVHDNGEMSTVALDNLNWKQHTDLFVESNYYELTDLTQQSYQHQFSLGIIDRLGVLTSISPTGLVKFAKFAAVLVGLVTTYGLSIMGGAPIDSAPVVAEVASGASGAATPTDTASLSSIADTIITGTKTIERIADKFK